MNSNEKARTFAALHVPGDPLILFNVWDPGTAQAVERSGAKAIATGSDSVARAQGREDGEDLPIEFAIANAERIVGAVQLPVTIDFEGGYSVEPGGVAENVGRLAATGAIGCNFEDQRVGGDGLYSIEEQAARIRAIREKVGAGFFINARTDLFLKAKPEHHDAAMVDEALERVRAYADAGASGFFVPLLADLGLLERLCGRSPLPVNAMQFPGAPSRAEWASAGIARISHGPFPHRALMQTLERMAREALA
jgi:2-methylisocitrate lyase-like PEP mutase family enzyme